MELWKGVLKTQLIVCCMCLLTPAVSEYAYTFDLRVKYFSNVSMFCDHPQLNVTKRNDVQSLVWVFPDGGTFQSSREPDRKLFHLSGHSPSLPAYNLTALNINDPVFGYYICVVIYQSRETPISVVRWGLNVDGADFSELLKTYEENAIVGGVAAAAVLALVAAGCLVWHFRYDNRHSKLSIHEEDDAVYQGVTKTTVMAYDNEGYVQGDLVDSVDLNNGRGGNNVVVKI